MLSAAPLTPGICLVIGRILLQNSLIFFHFWMNALNSSVPALRTGLTGWHLSPFPQNSEMTRSRSVAESCPSLQARQTHPDWYFCQSPTEFDRYGRNFPIRYMNFSLMKYVRNFFFFPVPGAKELCRTGNIFNYLHL